MQKTTNQLQSERMELYDLQARITKKLIHLDIEIAKRIKHEPYRPGRSLTKETI